MAPAANGGNGNGEVACRVYDALEEYVKSEGIYLLNAGIVSDNELSIAFHHRRGFYKAPVSKESALNPNTPGVYIKDPKILTWTDESGVDHTTQINWYTKSLK